MPFRIIAGVLGTFFFVQGLQWLITPASSAAALGMPFLDGAARSTQIGDISSFFLCTGAFAAYGAYAQNPTFVRAAGFLVGLVAVTRTIAWAFHGAAFANVFIPVEVIAGGAFLFVATRIGGSSAE